MKTKNVERSTVIGDGGSGARRGGEKSDTKSLVLLAVVLVALIGSAGALAVLSDNFASHAIQDAVAPAQDHPTAVPYFPSQYVNQAKDIEAQPPTF